MTKLTILKNNDPPADGAKEEMANRLLLGAGQALSLVRPELVRLRKGEPLYHADDPIRHVYFVNRGLVSLVKSMRDGRTVEVAAVGAEGVVGVSALFDVETSTFETMMQVPGSAYRASVENVRKAMQANSRFHHLLQGYVHVILEQIAQTAACNRLHSLDQRCCRWMLMCHDAARLDTFPLTHEFLAMMLGARRVSVSIVAAGLQKLGYIKYRHGVLTIQNRTGMEGLACECYDTLRRKTETLFHPN
ncbi:conserved hypothetical protein [uncultured Defluviicoccus sp.]|uniref:Cyclic nucleotide-binding domain-containing protein n=1 Tax=metagenome TaxID=256318 RepID=A0A380T8E4_9ZZZZ|nr:conserved hypothetical protein [uncultured Defluviicoccus sp.]